MKPTIIEVMTWGIQFHNDRSEHLYKYLIKTSISFADNEREQTRLQIELYNVQAMLGPPNQCLDGRSVEETNMQLMQSCTNIRYAISQIDFVKILQCNHMQMEQDWRKEWQQMQEYSVAILKCHEQMEQRDVVQRYRKVEIAYKEAKINSEKQKISLGKILNEGQLRLRGIKEKRNALIIAFVESCKDINSLKTEVSYDLSKLIAENYKKCF